MFNSRQCRYGNESGFTYMWVLFSVASMGVLLAIALDIDSTATRRDKEMELLAIGRQFREGLRLYQEASQPSNGVAAYPERLQDLLEDTRSGSVKRHLRKLFVDPMTGKAEWGLVMVGGRIVGIHSLSKERPIKQDGFFPENETFRTATRYSDWIFTYPDSSTVNLQKARFD